MSNFSKLASVACWLGLAAGCLLAPRCCPSAIAQEPGSDAMAIVLEVHGNATTDRATPLQRRDVITSATIHLESGSSILLAFPSGGELQRLSASDQAVSVSLTESGATAMDGLTISNIPGKIPAGSLAKLSVYTRAGAGQARSEIDPPGPPVVPIHDSLILTPEPQLSWPATDGIETYKVIIFKSGSKRKVFSASTTDNKLTVSKLLEPGSYQWTVTGTGTGNAKEEIAEFKVKGETVLKTFVVATESQIVDLQQLLQLANENPPSVGLLEFVADRLKNESAYAEAAQLLEKIISIEPQYVAAQVGLYELYRRAGRLSDAEQAKLKAIEAGFEFEVPRQ